MSNQKASIHLGILYLSEQTRSVIIGKFAYTEEQRECLKRLIGRGLTAKGKIVSQSEFGWDDPRRCRTRTQRRRPGKKRRLKVNTLQYRREIEELHRLSSGTQMGELLGSQDLSRTIAARIKYCGLDLLKITPPPRMHKDERETIQEIQECFGFALRLVEFAAFILATKHACALVAGINPKLKAQMQGVSIINAQCLEDRINRCRSRPSVHPPLLKKRKRKKRYLSKC